VCLAASAEGNFKVSDGKAGKGKFLAERGIIRRKVNDFPALNAQRVVVGFVLNFKKYFVAIKAQFPHEAVLGEIIECSIDRDEVDVGQSAVDSGCRKRFTNATEGVENFLAISGESRFHDFGLFLLRQVCTLELVRTIFAPR
jgi:hypothetical protein